MTPADPQAPHSPEAEWTTDEVISYLAENGRRIARSTWYSYVSREQAPAPRYVGRTPVWNPAEVRRWHAETRQRHTAGE